MLRDPALLERILAFEIDEGRPTLTFSRRLARENHWSPAFADRVVDEYKRFVYLAMAAGHPVTPSDHVDQAWHLHLTYTESYWTRLCAQVLPRPLHHNPTRGGDSEDAKFCVWYERTRASYREQFGADPPDDIWPPADVRFGEDPACVRVNTRRNVIVSKSALRRTGALSLLALGGSLAIAGCSTLALSGSDLLLVAIFAAIVVACVAVLARLSGRGRSHGSGCGGAGGCAASGCASDSSSGCGGGGGGGGCGGGCGS